MQTASVGITGQQTTRGQTGSDTIGGVELDDFMKLLIAELQNQDPMNPMDNHQILQQVSQIREIESNSKLTDTLESVLLGQNMTTASNMLGKFIAGLTKDGQLVTGQVERISVTDGLPALHVGEHMIDLKSVTEILSEDAEVTEQDDTEEES